MRLHDLSQRSLWADELFTLAVAAFHPLLPQAGQSLFRRTDVLHITDSDTFLSAKAAEQSPPLQDLAEKLFVQFLGPTELAARLPGALASCALLLWIATLAWRTRNTALKKTLAWYVLLLALHPTLIMYAREGRAYSLGVSLLGAAALLWSLRWRSGWRNWTPPRWGEILLLTLACLTHYLAAMLVALLLSVDVLMAWRQRCGAAAGRIVTLGLVFLVWLALNAHTIAFTAQGGVAWAQTGTSHPVWTTLNLALTALHLPWLVVTAVAAGWAALAPRRFETQEHGSAVLRRGLTLVSLTFLFILFAGLITAKAGMSHPRFFIFILPVVILAMAQMLAQLPANWTAIVAVAILVGLSPPSEPLRNSFNNDDFRSMTVAGLRGADETTLFLYHWEPNRPMYRLYLERYLGADPGGRLIGVSGPSDFDRVCNRLRGSPHVVVLSHIWGRKDIDTFYQHCAGVWPKRSSEQFNNTFAEHWRF